MIGRAATLFGFEIRLRARGASGPAAFGFFLLAGILTPLAVGTEDRLLVEIAPGLIWIFVSLAALVGLEGYFKDELADGRLAVLRLGPTPLWLLMLIMMTVFWLLVCAPVIGAVFPVLFLYGVEADAIWRIVHSLIIGTPAVAFIGACLGAVCAGLQRGAGLVMFLALPFFAPAMILGTLSAQGGELADSAIQFLAAFSLVSVGICPLLAMLAIQQNME